MTEKLFLLCRNWADQSTLTPKQKKVYFLHLDCAESMPLPGSFVYGIGTMEFKGKERSAEHQLVRLGLIEKISAIGTIPSTIYRLCYPRSTLSMYDDTSLTLEELIELLCGPIDQLTELQKQVYKGWIELSKSIPIAKGL